MNRHRKTKSKKKERGEKTRIFTGKKVLKKKRETERGKNQRGEIEFQLGWEKKNNLISGASGVIAPV